MKYFIIFQITIHICLTASAQHFDQIFVDKEWLNTRLDDKSIVILHTDKPENYQKGHIPGALFVENSVYAPTRNGLYFEMPEAVFFAEELQKRGIDRTKTVIISSGWETFAHAYRLYVTMEYFGLASRTRILDGGIRGWNAAGFSVSQDTVMPGKSPKRMTLNENPDMLASKDWVRENLENPGVCILDARSNDFYSGREKGNYQRGGHIRGAKNLTWTTLVDENYTLHNPEKLREMYEELVDNDRKLVTYCHVALRASVLYVVGKALGYDVLLYDGSFNEWDGQDSSYPVEEE